MLTMGVWMLLAAQDAELAIAFERVAQASRNAAGPEGQKVIRDEKAWKAFLADHGITLASEPPLPTLDFPSEAIVAVVDVQRPSTGYAVEITKIVHARDAIVIHVKHTGPPSGTKQATVLTRPSCIVRAKLPDLPVRFVDVNERPSR